MIMQILFGAVIYATPAVPEKSCAEPVLYKEGLPGKEILLTAAEEDADNDATLILRAVRQRAAAVKRENTVRHKPAFRPADAALPKNRPAFNGYNRRGFRNH